MTDASTDRPETPPRVPTRAPAGLGATLDELLRRPDALIARARQGAMTADALRLLVGAVLCLAVYGAAAGAFSGGVQIAVAAIKTPLIVLGSLALCAPSLYVLTAMAGGEGRLGPFVTTLAGLAALVALLLVALMPVVWLFSVSSRALGFLVFLHLVLWLVALGFGRRFLVSAFDDGTGSRFSLLAWTLLVVLVSFQVTTQVRPVLAPGETSAGKLSFIEHFDDALGVVLDGPADDEPLLDEED